MGMYDGYLICSDIDGTLAVNGEVPENNVEAIKRFQKGGGKFVIATGRDYDYIDIFADRFYPDKYIISGNGNVLYNTEKKLVEEVFLLDEKAEDIAVEVFDKFKEHLLGMECCGADGRIRFTKDDDADGAFKTFDGKVCKVVYSADSEETANNIKAYLKENYDKDYEIRFAWNTGVEFWSKGAGKERMVQILREKLSMIHTIICAGDTESDVPMFKESDIAYAPENASPEAKEMADVIGVHCMDGLIAQIVEDLDKK